MNDSNQNNRPAARANFEQPDGGQTASNGALASARSPMWPHSDQAAAVETTLARTAPIKAPDAHRSTDRRTAWRPEGGQDPTYRQAGATRQQLLPVIPDQRGEGEVDGAKLGECRALLRESDPYTATVVDAGRLDAPGADSLATSQTYHPESADPPPAASPRVAHPQSPTADAARFPTHPTGTGNTPLARNAAPQPTEDGLRAGAEVAAVCEEYLRLRKEGWSNGAAAHAVNKPASYFSGPNSVLARYRREGVAALATPTPTRPGGELSTRLEAAGWFVASARFFYMLTDRAWRRGSVPEAVRCVLSLPRLPRGWKTRTRNQFEELLRRAGFGAIPICPPELREEILARERAGRPLVPGRIARQIAVNPAVVHFERQPKDGALLYCNAAGCSKFTRRDGAYVPLYAGQRIQADDGSINFCVVVPWGFPTNPCARKYGAMVARFQLLLAVDALSLSIRARSFVVRPRSSYRQEDALHLYHIYMRGHGVPEEIWHEGGVWNSGRVKDCLDLLQIRRQRVHSPHAKAAVEGRFNKLWTVLSVHTAGQIGRFRGAREQEDALLESCRGGHTDPWKVFPTLEMALPAIDEAIAQAGLTPVSTDVGRWVPDELWDEHEPRRTRSLDPATEWMFWPWMVERIVNNGVKASVPLFEDFSVPFTFAATWMPQFHGARVRAYFDPYSEARSMAMCVLAADFEGHRAGEVLGPAVQTNDIAAYARQLLGYGTGPDDMGRRMRQAQAAALRSERRAIMPGGAPGARVSEERDGIETVTRIERDPKCERASVPGCERSEGNSQTRNPSYSITSPSFD